MAEAALVFVLYGFVLVRVREHDKEKPPDNKPACRFVHGPINTYLFPLEPPYKKYACVIPRGSSAIYDSDLRGLCVG